MASTRREDVKVVLIDTQYVEADPTSFKAVVQRLTGKDSCVAWIEESSFGGQKTRKEVAIDGGGESGNGGGDGDAVSMLSKGMSFKDLDRLIMELPPMEELQCLWTDLDRLIMELPPMEELQCLWTK